MLKLLFVLTLLGCSNCYLQEYPVTAQVADSATFKLNTGDYLGTAWAVNDHYLVTAGHMCQDAGDMVIQNGIHFYPANWVAFQYSESGQDDLCVLHTPVTLDRHLVIADQMPGVGESIGFVGYPGGEYYVGKGRFLGDMDGDDTENDAAFSAPADHGASGSAMFTSRGVWGVLVRRRTDGGYIHPAADGGAAVDLTHLVRFLNEQSVDYTVTPDPVTTDAGD